MLKKILISSAATISLSFILWNTATDRKLPPSENIEASLTHTTIQSPQIEKTEPKKENISSKEGRYKTQLTHILNMAPGPERLKQLEAFLKNLPPHLFPEIAELFKAVPENIELDNELSLLGIYWAKNDGESAVNFMTSLYPRKTGMITPGQSTIRSFAETNPAGAVNFLQRMPRNLRGWGGILFKGAFQQLSTMDIEFAIEAANHDDGFQHIAMQAIATHASPEDYPRISEWLSKASHENPLEAHDAVLGFLGNLTDQAPLEALNWVASALNDSETRYTALAEVVNAAAARSPFETGELLNSDAFLNTIFDNASISDSTKDQFKDYLMAEYLKGVSRSDNPGWAIENTHLISDPQLRASVEAEYFYNSDRNAFEDVWTTQQYDSNPLTPVSLPPSGVEVGNQDSHITSIMDAHTPSTDFNVEIINSASGSATTGLNLHTNENDFFYTIEANEPIQLKIKNLDRSASAATTWPIYNPVEVSQNGEHLIITAEPGQSIEIDFGAGRNAYINVVAGL